MKLFEAMATVASLTLISRVMGFVRDMALASVLGASVVADAFFVAMKLPNFFRRITAEGAFSVSFIPIYTRLKEKEGVAEAMKFASLALSGMSLILTLFCMIAMVFMPFVVHLLAPGFATDGESFTLAVEFSRVTFPFLLCASVAALIGGVLNAHNRFAPFAATSIILNASMLLFLLFALPFFDNAGMAVSWGITVSGVIQIVYLYYCARREGLIFALPRPRMTADVKTLLDKMGPGVLAAGVVQINLFVDVILASMLGTGAISHLYYADRLNQLPLGLVGTAIATALLPMLSSAIARGDEEESSSLFSRSLEFALVLTIPAAVALMILGEPIISTLFEHGKFVAHDTNVTGHVLAAYALGLVPFVVGKVYTTAFFARQDTATPVKVGIASAILNTVLCIILMNTPLQVVGIALSTTIAAWAQIIALHILLKKVPGAQADARLRKHLPRILIAAAVMAAVLCVSFFMPSLMAAHSKMTQVIMLCAVMAPAGLLYLAMVWRFRIVTKSDMQAFMKRPAKLKGEIVSD